MPCKGGWRLEGKEIPEVSVDVETKAFQRLILKANEIPNAYNNGGVQPAIMILHEIMDMAGATIQHLARKSAGVVK